MPCIDRKDAFLSGFLASFIFVSNTLHCFQQLIDRIETPALIRIGSFIPKPFYRPIILALYRSHLNNLTHFQLPSVLDKNLFAPYNRPLTDLIIQPF